MVKKSFFRERTISEIMGLNSFNSANIAKGLVRRIDDLNPSEDCIIVSNILIPQKFFRGVKNSAEASRKCYKHGDLVALSHPQTRKECYSNPETPLSMRARDFSMLEDMKDDDINFVGYSFQPAWGDRLKRVVPFVWCPEGLRLDAYAQNRTKGIKIENYPNARRVNREGVSFAVEVPSRTKKNPRYRFKLMHVPIIRGPENLATILTLKPAVLVDEETGEPERGRTPHDDYNIRYTWVNERERSDVITFYPHDIAAYNQIARESWKEHNMTPMEMNPFALFSRHGIEFYNKLCNNILVYDRNLKSRHKLRKLHLAEKSILLARAIGVLGHDEIAYWDAERDGKIKDYDWGVD